MRKFVCDACGAVYEGEYVINVQSAYGVPYVKCTNGDGFAFEVKEEKKVEEKPKTVAKKTTTTRKKQATQKEEEV